MRALVVYFSLSGTARAVAMELAKQLPADLEEIRCDQYRPGVFGFLMAGRDSWRGRLPEIGPSARDPATYDLVVIGGPLWAGNAATPIRAYLQRHAGRLPHVAFFLTHGGSSPDKALQQMATLAGQPAPTAIVLRQAEVKAGRFVYAVAGLAAKLRTAATVLPHAA